MTKLKLSDMLGSYEATRNLAATKLPVKISYQISRLNSEFDKEMKIYDEKRRALIAEYGEKNEETGDVKIDETNKQAVDKFYKDLTELMEIEIDLQFADKINIKDLGTVEIEPKNLPGWLFSDEE